MRLVRALEVHALTGRTQSSHFCKRTRRRAWAKRLPVVAASIRPTPSLRAALVTRTDAMIRAGLVEEAKSLRAKRHGPVRPLDAVGYKEALQLVYNRFHPSELGARIETASHQFAKRQRTWFQKVSAVVRVSTREDARAALERP